MPSTASFVGMSSSRYSPSSPRIRPSNRRSNANRAARVASRSEEAESERKAILREKQKLTHLINQAEKNQRQQKKAMEKLFQSEETDDPVRKGLYPEKKEVPTRQEDPDPLEEHLELSCFQWYIRMIGRCAEKLLDIIGHEDEATSRKWYYKDRLTMQKITQLATLAGTLAAAIPLRDEAVN